MAVIVSDTFGRPWREGAVNVALGVAGLRPLVDYRGCLDPYGRRLESTVTALADELAGAAEVVMRKTARHAGRDRARRGGMVRGRLGTRSWCATRAAICSAERPTCIRMIEPVDQDELAPMVQTGY